MLAFEAVIKLAHEKGREQGFTARADLDKFAVLWLAEVVASLVTREFTAPHYSEQIRTAIDAGGTV
ncbi:hypothetical protein [Cupriavidus pampae]|uniref:TetR family transcriptional regulator n=1 Tax=Cupriavidus pampae TaxID=659251 RepID=A0ABM8XUK8_9BURK|nr:hypothetical protein [Cupriavidus pampae]CAG9184050.1 hypothetical protein LMG32289_05496 [Cupriavidus pampae]